MGVSRQNGTHLLYLRAKPGQCPGPHTSEKQNLIMWGRSLLPKIQFAKVGEGFTPPAIEICTDFNGGRSDLGFHPSSPSPTAVAVQ